MLPYGHGRRPVRNRTLPSEELKPGDVTVLSARPSWHEQKTCARDGCRPEYMVIPRSKACSCRYSGMLRRAPEGSLQSL